MTSNDACEESKKERGFFANIPPTIYLHIPASYTESLFIQAQDANER